MISVDFVEAQTRLVAKLRQTNTAVVSQIEGPLTSLPGFSQRLKSCPGKCIGTGWIIPSTFPSCALSQFLWDLGLWLMFWYLSFSVVW